MSGSKNASAAPLDMENRAPPPFPAMHQGGSRLATPEDRVAVLDELVLAKSIAGAAALYQAACVCTKQFENNCAHFLSNAFIKAGYEELKTSACINAHCHATHKRPIRAKDMDCWFKSMAIKTERDRPVRKGFWAVFQFDDRHYCCGHVLILDTDKSVAYGTGDHDDWRDQYYYQW